MSITIRYTMGSRGFGSRFDDRSVRALAKETAVQMGYEVKQELRYTLFFLCPNGYISMRRFLGKLSGDCRTDAAGAGFHAAAVAFLEEIARKAEIKLKILDPTGYADNHDFLGLRSNYFYKPFGEMMERAAAEEAEGDPYLIWSAPFITPEPLKGSKIADVRQFSDREIRGITGSGMSMAFAKDFYLWNEPSKDAYFYRNGGLTLLNQDCCFKPSERSEEDKRINEAVIRYFEKALELDPGIPFPRKEYLEVCGLAGHEPVDMSSIDPMPEDMEVGCRKRMVYRTMGNTVFGIPGTYLMDPKPWEGMDHYYDGKEYGNHDYYIYGVCIEERGPAEFKENWFEQRPILEDYRFNDTGLEGRVVLFEPEEEDGEPVYTVCGQVLNGFQRNNVMIRYRNPEEKEWALGLVRILKNAEQRKYGTKDDENKGSLKEIPTLL